MGFLTRRRSVVGLLAVLSLTTGLQAASIITHPYVGITYITRTETDPRDLVMHIVQVNMSAPGLSFKVTPPGGTRETVRQRTAAYLEQEQAQVAVNLHFFLPFPSTDLNAMAIGLGASNGTVFSAFEAPVQSYAITTNTPAINIDSNNNAGFVHADTSFADGLHILENASLYNTFSGSAQIITDGLSTVPFYKDAARPDGLLTPGGPASYSNANSWYNLLNARTVIGLSKDNQTLTIFTVDVRGGSRGMNLPEIASLLIKDYGVYNALNMDGGGSTSLALRDPITNIGKLVNVSSDSAAGRQVATNLAIFALKTPEPSAGVLFASGLSVLLISIRLRKQRAGHRTNN